MNETNFTSIQRNSTLDVLRGIAIVSMILSNFAGELLKAPHPILVTWIGSLAAPLFVMIAGYLVGFSVTNKNYPFSYFLLRGFLTLLIGVCIDVFLWRSYPFISVDILYLTGLSIPITSLFMRMNLSFKVVFIFLFFIFGPLLRMQFGYSDKPSFPPIWKDGNFVPFAGDFFTIVKHWFIDGWFPIFSWMGVSFLGGFLAELKIKHGDLISKDKIYLLLLSFFLLLVGAFFWNHEFRLATRGNYTELFYPPTLSYYLVYIGLIFILYLIVDINSNSFLYSPFRLIGISPLFFYLLHFLIIAIVIAPFFGKTPEKEVYLDLNVFLISFLFIILVCILFSFFISLFKKKFQ